MPKIYSKEELLAYISRFENKHSRLPNSRDMRKEFGVYDEPFVRIFGSWKSALETYLASKNPNPTATEIMDKGRDLLLKTLSDNLTNNELKAIVVSTGSTSVKPKLQHNALETGYAKFLLVSDTHIGHSKFREDWWDHAVQRGIEEDCQFMLHAGDILEGMSTRPGHVYELDAIGFEAQFAKAKQLIGACPFPVKAITGNHDSWYMGKADQGTNVGLRLEESLDNFTYLGDGEADIVIEGVRIKLWHGSDGGSYAISYRGQKIVESLDGGDKPHILITGHDHKSIFFQTRNVHLIGAGTLCEQTSFMRGKKLAAHRGFWIVEFWSNEEGLVRIRPEWTAFY